MITDSIPWKEDLLRIARALRERGSGPKRRTERTWYLIERDLMVAALICRRLGEGRRISDRLAGTPIPVLKHEASDRPPGWMDVHDPWDHFDLDSGQPFELSLHELCNQLIHGWSFGLMEEEVHGSLRLLVSSLRHREFLYGVDWDVVVDAFQRVGGEDIIGMDYRRDVHGDLAPFQVWGDQDQLPEWLSDSGGGLGGMTP